MTAGAVPRPRGPVSEFQKGVVLGVLLSALAIGFMAAGRTADPDKLIAAMLARGVPIDERLERAAPAVRRALLCVAMAVLMEARGEPDAGQDGVAWVVRTRAAERGAALCDVVFEPAQFSWSAYPQKRIVNALANNGETLLEAQDVAWRVIVEGRRDPTAGANHFWGWRVMTPGWARQAAAGSKVVIGGHAFIRIPYRRSW